MIRITNDIVAEENKESLQEHDRELFLYIIASTFYKVGIEAFTMEENQVSSQVDRELDYFQEKRSVSTLNCQLVSYFSSRVSVTSQIPHG